MGRGLGKAGRAPSLRRSPAGASQPVRGRACGEPELPIDPSMTPLNKLAGRGVSRCQAGRRPTSCSTHGLLGERHKGAVGVWQLGGFSCKQNGSLALPDARKSLALPPEPVDRRLRQPSLAVSFSARGRSSPNLTHTAGLSMPRLRLRFDLRWRRGELLANGKAARCWSAPLPSSPRPAPVLPSLRTGLVVGRLHSSWPWPVAEEFRAGWLRNPSLILSRRDKGHVAFDLALARIEPFRPPRLPAPRLTSRAARGQGPEAALLLAARSGPPGDPGLTVWRSLSRRRRAGARVCARRQDGMPLQSSEVECSSRVAGGARGGQVRGLGSGRAKVWGGSPRWAKRGFQ